MHTVHLHGPLKEHFGGPYEFDIANALDAFRALSANFPDFRRDLIKGSYQIIRGDLEDGMQLGEEELTLGLGNAKDLHIVPVIEGAGGNSGVGKVVLGVAIVALAVAAPYAFGAGGAAMTGSLAAGTTATAATTGLSSVAFAGVTYGSIAGFGLSMALAGVAQMLSPTPKFRSIDPKSPNNSFLFSGPLNTTEQGVPVPLVYGRVRTGSVLASFGLEAEEVED